MKKKKERLIKVKWFVKDLMNLMILENLKQYVFLALQLEMILLIWVWQNHLSKHTREFKSKTKPQNSKSKKVKKHVLNSAMALLKGREMIFKAFESGILLKLEELKQSKKGIGINILTPKQMLQRLPIALGQVKSGNNSKILLN